ncbi:glyoxal oxidase N-terminus-domain-containing protein [Fimicolochytrium jonesii]|uniref:glyoxal oxidase N-terminus-domain-containing protein n=1 Tax=Fimicolochytrium jonesii TaxID=1396493 RepID=UPI0022FDD51A|nr:glyoxal oxidase N-terminus-domain-containing protein [Fimicolochytrium jonesii]KAI8825761.1 glyoxal oxidase N-terminus-domain-containing protein [Fimicolochytrium jonesii]
MFRRGSLAVAALNFVRAASILKGADLDGEFKVVSDNSGVVGVHMSLLPGNKLLLSERFHEVPSEWLGPRYPNGDANVMWNGNQDQMQWAATADVYKPNKNLVGVPLTDTAEFDINTNNFTMIAYPALSGDEGYAFCNGASQMPDGGIMVVGGDQKYGMTLRGVNYTSDGRRDIRVYKNGAYTKVAEMNWVKPDKTFTGRWYPTVIGLPNENMMIIGGQKIYFEPNEPRANNPTYEIYQGPGQVAAPVNVSILQKSFPINMYPISYVMPKTGNIFAFAGNQSAILDIAAKSETPLPQLPNDNIYPRSFPFAGTNFLLPLTKANNYTMTIWVCGGVEKSTAADGPAWYSNCSGCKGASQCYHIDPESDNPQWTPENMIEGRSQPIAVSLPDSTIVILNGGAIGHQGGNAGIPIGGISPTNRAMIFDPSQRDPALRWRLGATATVPRQYHGSALLTTYGYVIIGGSDEQNFGNTVADSRKDPYEMRLEVYYPSYFKIPNRPALDLTRAPASVHYGQKFLVQFTDDVGANISSVNFIKYATSTHTMNNDQRLVELNIEKYGKNKLLVTTPANSRIATPGNYMLWAIDNRGAPVMQAATINLRASNAGTDVTWDDADTVQPAAPPSAQPGWGSTNPNPANRTNSDASNSAGRTSPVSVTTLMTLLFLGSMFM